MITKRATVKENLRAYSLLTLKAVNDDSGDRLITGIASTPTPDRVGDIMDPKGAVFNLPIPLLWQHDHGQPIGEVYEAKVTKDGIEIKARLVKPTADMPSQLAARLDEAWFSIKTKLVRGLSIGFCPVEYSFIDGGGVRYMTWDFYELSAVTIPMNAEATISALKSIDRQLLATNGNLRNARVKLLGAPPVDRGNKPVVKLAPVKDGKIMNLKEKIDEARAKAMSIKSHMDVLVTKSVDSGETMDAADRETYDNHKAEYETVIGHLKMLEDHQKMLVIEGSNADPVPPTPAARVAGIAVKTTVPVNVKNTQKLEPGIAFARAAKCLALGHIEHRDAIQIAQKMFDGQDAIIAATQRLVTKAAVPAATTTNTTWAGALVGEETAVFADFAEFLRPQTILGRFGANGIPALRRVPFRTRLLGQTSGGGGFWVGEGQAKPLTQFDFTGRTLTPLKVANIAVATMETVRDSSPSADIIIRDQLAAALKERMDLDFIDPAKAAVADVSPASVLNGVAAVISSGTDANAVRTDVKALFARFIAGNNAPTNGVWVMSATTALALSLMQNPLGQSEFPGIGMNGGTFMGLPAIVSEYTPRDSDGGVVALINASDIYLGDEGEIDLSISMEASLQMESAPDNPTTASTVLVSLWQRNLVGFRAERTINWDRRRDTAVAYLTGVNWGAGS